ncbi:ISL3 family transposase [Nocardioides sp. NBC_00368]|uniref:ISL3 family transposase n=1 Tax=Nocardioides sp. TaxID=35761 RepID=UPI0019961636|nr:MULTISPECIES: ISL3 family transposase [unclassified Nocardioides]MBC7277079.1 ISL3 family transposase [Nocardioides sp.]
MGLARIVFSGLAALVIHDVVDVGSAIRVHARTRAGEVGCPACGVLTRRVHSYHLRTVADVPVDGREVIVKVRVRRLRCLEEQCVLGSFREQVPDLLERHQRRTIRLNAQVAATVRELAGRASARVLPVLGVVLSRWTALRALMRIPLPAMDVPRVLGIDDFALRRSHEYATILIDAETGRRIDVIPTRLSQPVQDWLTAHPGAEIVCRDGSGAYSDAITQALPAAIQVSDRWHLWHGLGEAIRKEVAGHATCWTPAVGLATGLQDGPRAATTRDRWQQVHGLLDAGVGLLDCSRRLGLALNTVKRYARVEQPEQLRRAHQYRPTLVDPYRDHLRARRAEQPGIPLTHLLAEIRELGYQGSSNLLVRYINQGRLDGDRSHLSPRKAARLLLTNPANLSDVQQKTVAQLSGACAEMTALTSLITSFAALLTPCDANDTQLDAWITAVREADLPSVHSFSRGLDLDRAAVDAGLTLPHHNGRTEGVNNKIKLLKRQMYGRAGFDLLRHRILLN